MSTPPTGYELGTPLDDTAWSVRENLTDVLRREILGPQYGDEEVLAVSPEVAYIIGRIAPKRLLHTSEPVEVDTDLDEDAVTDPATHNAVSGIAAPGDDDTLVDADEDGAEDQAPRRGLMIPASMGLRFQVPLDQPTVTVHASWGTYRPRNADGVDASGRQKREYVRTAVHHTVTLHLAGLPDGTTDVIELEGPVVLKTELRTTGSARLVEVALCNDADIVGRIPVHAWLFQTELHVEADGQAVFLPVNDRLEEGFSPRTDDETRRLALQYRDRLHFALGRTCSVDWHQADGTRRADRVWTTWLPVTETPQVDALVSDDVVTDMRALAEASPAQLEAGLRPIVTGYRTWLDAQRAIATTLPEHLRTVADETIHDASRVADRLDAGIDFLVADDDARACFAFMNTVMAEQRVHGQVGELRARNPRLSLADAEATIAERGPDAHRWRLFQLAFVLMQVPALCDPGHRYRSEDGLAQVELLFFPTGGGKTEAYLGLAAFTFSIRRLQGVVDTPDGPLDGSDGLAVLMRYTLRLLTAQQFQRASTMVCAAERERRKRPDLWGDVPFRIGLWVGMSVSPKTYEEARKQLESANDRNRDHGLTVLQLKRCPWCGAPITRRDVHPDDLTRRMHIHCSTDFGECPFSLGGDVDEGLPVLTVDEEIYHLAPAMVIATVDKFARLAREGAAATLFGQVSTRCPRHGYVHPDEVACKGTSHPRKGDAPASVARPAGRLRPPDLVIQDELHLITGALGTTVGLFEAAVDTLTAWRTADGRRAQPLIVASSATVRNAAAQVKGLYGRNTAIFPPQVIDAADTWFSREVPISSDRPGRRYVGVCASGVRLTAAEIRLAEVLMAGAQLLLDRGGQAADPYMTLVGYFNATRELAGMRRYLTDDVQTALHKGRSWSALPTRRGTGPGQGGSISIEELTSRASSTKITETLDQLALPFDASYDSAEAITARLDAARAKRPVTWRKGAEPLDVVLATSMLQVGVDVTRLGLMLMVGQPKNTAEYIQASSRVGRDGLRPGLVIALGNWARPRDLAHFEDFRHYHETFYSQVEALSVTPWSVTSIERGMAGALVAATRAGSASKGADSLSVEKGAGHVVDDWEWLQALAARLNERAGRSAEDEESTELVRQRLVALLEMWKVRRDQLAQRQQGLAYEKTGTRGEFGALMKSAEIASERRPVSGPPFIVANSMREVQPEVNILVSPDKEHLFLQTPANAPQWDFSPAKENR